VPDEPNLRKEAEDAFGLSYADELKLWLAWRVVKRKVLPMNGNHALTALGVVAGILNYMLVVLQNGTPIPQNSRDWIMLGLSATIAALGGLAKAASVGSQPGDPLTPSRIVGAEASGQAVPVDDIAAAAAAVRSVVPKT
jgi:hypothetical protein